MKKCLFVLLLMTVNSSYAATQASQHPKVVTNSDSRTATQASLAPASLNSQSAVTTNQTPALPDPSIEHRRKHRRTYGTGPGDVGTRNPIFP